MPKDPRQHDVPAAVKRAVTEGAPMKTPAGGVSVPQETWEGEDQKSGVHPGDETQLATIERVAREVRKTGSSTFDTLQRHESDIKALVSRVTTVEIVTTETKDTVTDIKTEMGTQSKTMAVQDAKLDTMLTILDPSAPQRVREIVATELRISDREATAAERAGQLAQAKTVIVEKTKLNIELVKQVGIIAAALIAGGGLTLLARGCP